MLDFRTRVGLLLLLLGAGLMLVILFEKQRSMPAILACGAGVVVFYSGLYVLLRRRQER